MYRKRFRGWAKHLDFIILDMLSLAVSFALGFVVRPGRVNLMRGQLYRNMLFIILLIDLVVILFAGTFKNVLKRGILSEAAASVRQAVYVGVFGVFYLYLIHSSGAYSRFAYMSMMVIYAGLSFAVRSLWKSFLHRKMEEGGKIQLFIVTTSDRIPFIKENILDRNYQMYHFSAAAIIDRNMKGTEFYGVPVAADQDTLIDYLTRNWVDEVLFDIASAEDFPKELINEVINMGITVHLTLQKLIDMEGGEKSIEKVGTCPVITASIAEVNPGEYLIKRITDIVGSIVGCAITLVLTVILGPLIYIASPGPIFFHQTRIGQNGRKFEMYKFRSMYPDAEERKKELMRENGLKEGQMFKMKYDPRIIGCRKLPDGTIKKGIGNFIRDTSLDEFPQFFNVLKGDMSLVGTRPPTVDEWERYNPYHRSRMSVRPGITGIWQVEGRGKVLDFDDVARMDREYIEHWSIGLDIRILCRTVYVVITRRGAM
jgi:exopolysaccharide biosynthesis polyprenyl glycosylphosphotransferase